MNCPVCGKEANLYAETKPNGKIGCFCRNCKKGYHTTNPEDGWEIIEYNFDPPKSLINKEIVNYHNIDVTKEILELVEWEFKAFITGEKWRSN